jgi:hypothetical protein
LYNIESHPNWGQTEASETDKGWFLDMRPVLRLPLEGGKVTVNSKTGSLYDLTVTGLDVKRLPLMAFCKSQPLRDVSSPATGHVLATDASTPFQVCVALKDNECRNGSTAGRVYVNCPYNTDNNNIWVSGGSQSVQAMIQTAVVNPTRTPALSRVLTFGLSRYLNTDVFWSTRSLPSGGWALFQAPLVNGQRSEVLAAKLPPWPGGDSVNRATFQSLQIQLGSVPAGTDNIIAEFGYDTNFYCTSRQEACIANQAAVNETTPFYWASEAYSGIGCASGCIITIPVIPQRIVYYRLKYRDPGGATLATGETRIAVTP